MTRAEEIAGELRAEERSVLHWLQPNPSGNASFDIEDIDRMIAGGLVRRRIISQDDEHLHVSFALTDLGREVARILEAEKD